jgi:hypothetical protein
MYNLLCASKVASMAICLAISSGCAPAVRVVEGKVTLDGQALASGAIDFEPVDGRGRLIGAEIKEGGYRIEIPHEATLGKSVVRILSPQPTGRKVPAGPPAAPGVMIEEIAEAVPAQYNTKSTLKVDLSIASPHNFELLSSPKPNSLARPARN